MIEMLFAFYRLEDICLRLGDKLVDSPLQLGDSLGDKAVFQKSTSRYCLRLSHILSKLRRKESAAGRYGRFLACPGYPECKNAKPIINYIDVPCPVCGARVIEKKSRRGRKFYVCENSPENCNYISWNKPKIGEKWSPEENTKKVVKRKKTSKKKKSTSKKSSK